MLPTTALPDDPALPGLAAIRRAGLDRALPALGFTGDCDLLQLCGYTSGERATIEVRAAGRHFAVKAYAEDPTLEAALYEAFAVAGPAHGANVYLPRLLASDREL